MTADPKPDIDIVDRLNLQSDPLSGLAADTITDLRKRVEEKDAALKPFAAVAALNAPLAADWPDDKPNHEFSPSLWPSWGDFCAARRALTTEQPDDR